MMPKGALWLDFEVQDFDDDRTFVIGAGYDGIERELRMPLSRLATEPRGDFEWPLHIAMRFDPQQSAYFLEPSFGAMEIDSKVIKPKPVDFIEHEFRAVESSSRLRGIFKGVFKAAIIIVPCLMFLPRDMRAMERDVVSNRAAEKVFWSGDRLNTGGAGRVSDQACDRTGEWSDTARASLQHVVERRALAALEDVKERGRIR